MAYRVFAKIQDGAISLVVETAKEALAKATEFAELGHADVTVRDYDSNELVEIARLQAEAESA